VTDFVQHQLFRPYIIKSCIEEEDENSVWQWRAESFLAWQWQLPAAGRDGTWTVRTVSRLMWMCGDIFAAQQLWRGLLLTTGHLSSLHPVVVGAGDVSWGSRVLIDVLSSECRFSAV